MARKGTVLSKKAEAKGQELYAKSLELSTRFDDNFMELARNLRSLQETDSDRFKDLIDKSGLGRRKAYYLVALDKALGNVKISKQRLSKLGWTKMALMAPVVTKYNFAEMLEFAETTRPRSCRSRCPEASTRTTRTAYCSISTSRTTRSCRRCW